MLTKDQLRTFVDASTSLHAKQMLVDTAFRSIDVENVLISLIPSDYTSMVDMLLISHVGDSKFESLMWWIYDTVDEHGDRTAFVEDTTGGVLLSTFDEFYAFIFENVQVCTILKCRLEA